MKEIEEKKKDVAVMEGKSKEKPKVKEKPKLDFLHIVESRTDDTVFVGKVLKLINQNYGLGVCIKKKEDGTFDTIQVLFDLFDVWSGDNVLANLKKKLQDALKLSGYILVNAILIENTNS